MKLRYAIYPNPLTADREDCTARIMPTGKITFEQFRDRLAERNTTVSRSDAYAVLEDAIALAVDLLRDGYIVDTGLVILFLALRGKFQGQQDLFDPARHDVVVCSRPSRRVRREFRFFRAFERVLPRALDPILKAFVDANSGTRDERITPGGIARLSGKQLQFDLADPSQGIFFVDEARHGTRVEVVILNKPRQLFFQIPDLPAGRYRVEVRNIPRHGNRLRTGALDEKLLVE